VVVLREIARREMAYAYVKPMTFVTCGDGMQGSNKRWGKERMRRHTLNTRARITMGKYLGGQDISKV
jgi:ribosomal protein L3